MRYRWLLPPDWVAAATLPPRGRSGIEPLRGVGDRRGQFTAVLGVLRGFTDAPHQLLARGAAPGATLSLFTSRAGPVAERIERKADRTVVTTVHAFVAAGEPYRFFVAALGPSDGPASDKILRTLGTALALANDLDRYGGGRVAG